MTLKPRISGSLGMICGGAILSFYGLRIGMWLGGYLGLLPALFGIFGLGWLWVGSGGLGKRNQRAITIDGLGIDLPAFAVFPRSSPRVFIDRDNITLISKHETMRGRLIEITTKNHEPLLVMARFYCDLDEFIAHCKRHGLPAA